MTRASGALLHISSLPGPFGTGCFGEEALDFARLIRKAGFTYWQVLPFSHPGTGDSPYQSYSAFAGNAYFIDPRQLRDDNLLSDCDLEEAKYCGNIHTVDYKWLRPNRLSLLRKAYANISKEIVEETEAFCVRNSWIDDVALYETIKGIECGKSWWDWENPDLRMHRTQALAEIRDKYHEDYFFHCFVQYEFYTQWMNLKRQINDIGISVIGDIPIYVSSDSADVWANNSLFQMKPDHTLSSVAGVPPDYFSEDGQLWGNPLYDWEAHAKDGYAWWIERLAVNFSLFDKVRIDHFRGFCSYWSVGVEEVTARNGMWVKGPGMDLFRKVEEYFPNPPIIAEDLGEIDDAVRDFLMQTGFPGMRVLQFGFDPNGDSTNLPHNFDKNTTAYTGTHDNNTLLGWLWDASEDERRFALAYCNVKKDNWGTGGPQSISCRAMIRQVWQSHADLVIAPVQDILGYGSDTRMNIPGTPEGNWVFRVSQDGLDSMDAKWLRELTSLYRRLTPDITPSCEIPARDIADGAVSD